MVIPMYNLIEYSDNYLKVSGSLWQYYRDEPLFNNNNNNNNNNILDFTVANNNSKSLGYKQSKRSNRQRWHKKC